jgi:NitT/TauT family transport system ATP-binding protein
MRGALVVRDLWKTYGAHTVLERVRLQVAAGEFCAIVGASGCGKTTFLRILLGEERQTRGSVSLDGLPLAAEPGPERGVVFQRYSVFPHLTVLDNVVLGLELAAAPVTGRLFGRALRLARDEAMASLHAVGLAGARNRYPAALSGGMQQRLALAQALIKRPRMLLLDEPFGALDPGTRKDMHQLVLRLWTDHPMTVFMVTHDLAEGFHLATRVLVFDKVRHDPQEPDAYGATITYDLPLTRKTGEAAIEREIARDIARHRPLPPEGDARA